MYKIIFLPFILLLCISCEKNPAYDINKILEKYDPDHFSTIKTVIDELERIPGNQKNYEEALSKIKEIKTRYSQDIINIINIRYKNTKMVYIGEDQSIYIMNIDGTEKKPLVTKKQLRGLFYAPCWSPDGKKITFYGDSRDYSGNHIFIVNADGSGFRQLTFDDKDNEDPSWSEDSKNIIYTKANRLYSVNIETNQHKLLYPITESQKENWWPVVFPLYIQNKPFFVSHKKIYYLEEGENVELEIKPNQQNPDIDIIDGLLGYSENLEYSTAKQQIVFDNEDIRILDLKSQTIIEEVPQGTNPTWAPDGEYLAVEKMRDKYEIWVYPVNRPDYPDFPVFLSYGRDPAWSPLLSDE